MNGVHTNKGGLFLRKRSKKLVGLLMLLTLFVRLFCGVRMVEAASNSGSTSKRISVYDNSDYAGSVKATVSYTYNNVSASITSWTVDDITYSGGYIIKNVRCSTSNGTSAKCTVKYDFYLG